MSRPPNQALQRLVVELAGCGLLKGPRGMDHTQRSESRLKPAETSLETTHLKMNDPLKQLTAPPPKGGTPNLPRVVDPTVSSVTMRCNERRHQAAVPIAAPRGHRR